MTICPASGTQAWFRGRPRPPRDAPNEVHLTWAYREAFCDTCQEWISLVWSGPHPTRQQILADHCPARRNP